MSDARQERLDDNVGRSNFRPDTADGKISAPISVRCSVPYKRENLIRWDGWGYKDSGFIRHKDTVRFAGNRYSICQKDLPYFLQYVKDRFGVEHESYDKEFESIIPKDYKFQESRLSDQQMKELQSLKVKMSTEGLDRLFHAHGQTLHEIIKVRNNTMNRIPDIVIWPNGHDKIVEIVKLADRLNIVLIPFGGGTSVSGSIECPEEEQRPIVSLDMSDMNRILWIDRKSLTVCCEAGIIGQDLERELAGKGYTTGHEPDSIEFSTVGGWVATRASGMKKNTYGNIEDLLVHVKLVSPRGVLEKGCRAPRVSCGPDFNNIVLGSEGCFGVITEVILKIRPVPSCTHYGSLVFPDFESGVHCLREIALQRLQPTSIRLMDNEQYRLGMSLRTASSYFGLVLQGLQMMYIKKIKGFDVNTMCLATLIYVGEKEDVLRQEKKVNTIAVQFGAVPAGGTNGERGYAMTYIIAYIRDIALYFNVLGETLETSVPWDRVLYLIGRVRTKISEECAKFSITRHSTMCRVTQTYDSGCCIYFYFVFNANNCREPLETTHHLEDIAREEIMAAGGSISHHHGIGKMRKKWYERTVSTTGKNIFAAIKDEVDPNNIFSTFNLTDIKTKQSKL